MPTTGLTAGSQRVGRALAALLCCMAAASVHSQPVTGPAEAKAAVAPPELWAKIREAHANPDKKVLDRCAVVERVPIVRAEGDVSPLLAAVASVLEYFNKGLGPGGALFRPDDTVVRAMGLYVSAELRRGDKSGQKCLREYVETMKALEERCRKEFPSGRPDRNPTYGLGIGRLLFGMAKGHDLLPVLREFYAARLYAPEIRKEPATYEACRLLLDNGVPFVLIRSGDEKDVRVCVGYADYGQNRCLIAGNPSRIGVSFRSRAEMTLAGMDGDERDEVKRLVERELEALKKLDEQFGKVPRDWLFELKTAEQSPGIQFLPWESGWNMLVLCTPRSSPALVQRFCDRVLRPW